MQFPSSLDRPTSRCRARTQLFERIAVVLRYVLKDASATCRVRTDLTQAFLEDLNTTLLS